jgi:tetratricopeptide (TPR) repeat protein
MNAAERSPAPPTEPDAALDELLDRVAEKIRAGEAVDVEALAREHPERAGELRRMLPAMQVLAGLDESRRAAEEGDPCAEPLPLGTLGDFRLFREVGRGGMGVVYEAEQISLGRRVALKVLPLAATMDPRYLQRFHNEARAAAALHHPNIVPVYAVGQERGVHFYAMQFIDGRTLAAYIAERRSPTPAVDQPTTSEAAPLPAAPADTAPVAAATASTLPAGSGPAYFRRVAELGVQAAEALEHAHRLGVVHRDIKPANLMLDAAGLLWVTDFGLARLGADSGLTATGDLLGTLRYMSPEQALAKHGLVDHRTDVYALGVTLYELLALRPAIDGKDRGEILQRIAAEDPTPPRRLDRAIPAELETIILKAIEKNPAERYGTAQELADDLGRFLKDEPIRARRPTPVQRLRKWVRRHQAVVATAAAGMIVAVGVAAGGAGWVLRDQAAQRSRSGDEAGQAVQELETLRGERRWPEAIEVARRAERLLTSGRGDPDQLRRVRELLRDVQMAQDLEEIRGQEGDAFEFAPVERDYALAFQRFGIDVEALDPAEAAERIRARSVSAELAAAVDYWALRLRDQVGEADAEKWQRLVQVARLADPDERRQQVRDALLKRDKKTLKQLAADPKTPELPASTLDLLGMVLDAVGSPEAAENFLRAAQLRHPNDFWINHRLAWCLMSIPRRREALRFYTVAVGLRPRSSAAWVNLGGTLYQIGATDDAAAALHEALRLNPNNAAANNNLGNVLSSKGDYDGAIAAYEKAAGVGPEYCDPHVNFAKVLTRKGDFDRAVVECEKAIRLQPRSIEARGNLGLALSHKGAYEKAVAAHREAIALAEKRAQIIPRYRFQVAWQLNNLAIVYPEDTRPEIEQALRRALIIAQQLEKEDRQSAECRELLGTTYNNLGLYLRRSGRHAEAEKALREAVRYQELAVESDPTPERRFWLATHYLSMEILLSAEGRLPEAEKFSKQAAELLRELVKDCPDVAEFKKGLAMSHFNRGLMFEIARPADAEKELKEAVKLFQELVDKHANVPEYRAFLGTSYNSLGRVLIRGGGRAEAAEKALREAEKLLEPLTKKSPGVALYRKFLAVNYSNLASLLEEDRGRAAEAETFENKSLELHEGLARDEPTVPEYKSRLAGSLHSRALDLKNRNEFAEARKVMERAVGLQRAALDATGGRQWRYRELLRDHYWGLTEIHLAAGDHATAAETAENLPRLFPDGWEEYFRAGSMLGKCAVAARQDARLSPEERKQRDSAYKSRVKELCATAAKRIAAADPKTAEARLDFAQGAVKIGTFFALEHEWALAKQNFDKAIDLQPTLAEAHFALGDMLYHQRQLPDAAAAFSKAVALRPDYAEAYEGLGKALDEQDNAKDAVVAYRAAVKLYTDKDRAARIQVNLGNCLARHHQIKEAEKEFRLAVELQPKLADAHCGLGRALLDQNKTKEAVPSFRAAIDIKPDYALAYEFLGMALDSQGETEDAVAAYRTAAKFYTDKAVAARLQINLGNCLEKHGRLPEAEKEFRRAVDLQPNMAQAHFGVGLALAKQDKTQEALPWFREAVKLQPNYAQAWSALGVTLQIEGEFADALKAFEKSRDLLQPDDPNRPPLQQSIDRCHRLIDLERKLAEIRKGDAKPENAAERVELAQVCVAKKQYGAAAQFYKEAFAGEPRLAADLRAGRRYEAARAASRAGCGQGKDDPALDEEARAVWRNQALDWLKADLALWGRLVPDGTPAARAAAGQKLAQWQGDAALAGVRGAAIGELPEAEREAWQKLWADVEALQARTKQQPREPQPDKQ